MLRREQEGRPEKLPARSSNNKPMSTRRRTSNFPAFDCNQHQCCNEKLPARGSTKGPVSVGLRQTVSGRFAEQWFSSIAIGTDACTLLQHQTLTAMQNPHVPVYICALQNCSCCTVIRISAAKCEAESTSNLAARA